MFENPKKVLKNWIISSLLLTLIFTAVFLSESIPVGFDKYIVLKALSDGFFASGSVVLCISLLIVIGRAGLFDTAAFGFVVFGESLKKDSTHKYKDAYDYKQKLEDKRRVNKPFLLPYWILGAAALALAVIFVIISISYIS